MSDERFIRSGSEANHAVTDGIGGRLTQRRLLATAVAMLAIALAASSMAASLDDPVFKPCAGCHEIGPGAKHKVGPHLDAIVGRKAGSIDGFKYSKAMKGAGEGGLAWDEKSLDAYIAKPRDFIPGNRMSFRGMEKAEARAELVKWIVEKGKAEASPADLPETAVAGTSAREFADAVLAIEGDKEFGQYLGGDCVTCHQLTGHADGIPSIVGLPRDYFVRALLEYKTNVRKNEVMKLRVVNLANEEIAALAAYFSSIEPK